MKAISIVGYKNSGKTTLVALLAKSLEARGVRVAIAKHTHHALDKPDTDTARFCQQGRVVIGISQAETAVFFGESRPLLALLPLIQADILLVEGGKQHHFLPRILCLHDVAEYDALHKGLTVASYGSIAAPHLPHFAIDSIEALVTLVEEKAFLLPGLDCGACGYADCHIFAQALISGSATLQQCVTSANSMIRIQCNGQPLPLNPFTARIVRGAVQGMLREMKGVTGGRVVIDMQID